MEVVRLPKKYRDLCGLLMDGGEPDPKLFDAFREKFPHQAAAVEAEIAAFQMDWETVLEKELFLLPFLREWYYSNVPAQQMTLLAFAARQLGREAEARAALAKMQEDLLAENPEADRPSPLCTYAGYMLDYLDTSILPYHDELNYSEPAQPRTVEELQKELTPKERGSSGGQQKLLNFCCLYGTAAEALALYEELVEEGTLLTEMWHQYAIQRYLYLGNREAAIQTAERWGASRMWAMASPTQVRPVCFFQHPMLHPFLTDRETIGRLGKSAFRKTGTAE